MNATYHLTMNIVLLPGFMLDADLWQPVAMQMASEHSVSFGDLSRGRSIEEMAQQVLAAAPSKFVAVGFSMGGYVAREIARQAPERIQGLVLVASSARGDNTDERERKARSAEHVQHAAFAGLPKTSILNSLHPSRRDDTELVARINDMAKRLGAGVFVRQMAGREGDEGRLAEITCPTLVVASMQDEIRSMEESTALQVAIPSADLAIIHGAGHMLPLEKPNQLARLIEGWIRQRVSAKSKLS